jgi:hypothetical protein
VGAHLFQGARPLDVRLLVEARCSSTTTSLPFSTAVRSAWAMGEVGLTR